ncbi:Nramp family divalent metal transporter [Kangiella sp. HZ709]|uniref:Nramp family divalent metal transporter n=1 Tax=Kangiella sp. HZ709 TaxID=2666328 RepID=UPI0012B0A9FF|nr:Nramp family divalent metal transporter [Kangiella sp. HZ709]MRX27554.1 divalent metal cation transporter [Kangiella sp. HZ709]
MSKIKSTFGPATLVTAAFIGPGTVTAATKAGANFGFALLWALLFSVIATMILQEMTARLGVVGRKELGQAIREQFSNPFSKAVAVILVLSAILVGNAAYEGGNIAGAALGINTFFENDLTASLGFDPIAVIIGLVAFVLLWSGSYQIISKAIIILVLLMSIAFITSFVFITPNFSQLFSGLLIPSIPDGSTLTIIALIGTTVVPYNLFLHSASAKKHWESEGDLPLARKDIFISIPLGGLISIAIVSTAATAFFGKQIEISGAQDLALSIQPLFGISAKYLMAIGLFAAGISSAITAPLATAYALSGLLNLSGDLKALSFRAIWVFILIAGVLVASSGLKPINIIWFAQVANGILLPIVAIFLLWTMNQQYLGKYKNNVLQNTLGLIVILVTLMLSTRSLMSAFGLL